MSIAIFGFHGDYPGSGFLLLVFKHTAAQINQVG